MRLHFLQATRQIDCQSSSSIATIANQLNYILRDLESIGKIPSQVDSEGVETDSYRSDYTYSQHAHKCESKRSS